MTPRCLAGEPEWMVGPFSDLYVRTYQVEVVISNDTLCSQA